MKTGRWQATEPGQQLHPLTKVQGIHVWVSHLDPRLVADGLDASRLWLEVHQQLTRAGLPVVPHRSWSTQPSYPCLGILIHADPANVLPPVYIFSIEVFFVQKISLTGPATSNAMRMTWCREAIGDVRGNGQSFDWSNLYSTLQILVDGFIQEVVGKAAADAPSKAIN